MTKTSLSLVLTCLGITLGLSGLALNSAAPLAEPAPAKSDISIREWKVENAGRARDPFAVDGKTVWFVDQKNHDLAVLDTESGEIKKYPIPSKSGPHNLIVGSDGIVWYAGNLKGYIGRFDPKTASFEKIAMPDAAAKDPHTLIFDEGQKHIWFTVQHGNFIGRMSLATRKVDLIPVPTRGSRPYGIKLAPDGTVWAVLFATNKLASVDPETLALTEHEIPDEYARPRRLAITSDGVIWFADYTRGMIGAFDPKSKKFSDYALPSKDNALPYGMAVDDRQRLWVVETGVSPNQFVGFDTASKKVISVTKVPSGGGAIRHMHYHRPTQTVWFGTDTHTVGRALLTPETTEGVK